MLLIVELLQKDEDMADTGKKDPMLSVIIPARDEAASLGSAISKIIDTLDGEMIPFEILVVDDHSRDDTEAVIAALRAKKVYVYHPLRMA